MLRYIDEAIKVKGDRLVPGKWNDIDYGDGRHARMFVDKDYNIMGFHPTTWPGSFEMTDTYRKLKLVVP